MFNFTVSFGLQLIQFLAQLKKLVRGDDDDEGGTFHMRDYKPFRVLGPRARVKLSNLKLFHARGPILSFKAFLVCPVQNFLDSCGFLPFGSLVRWLGRKILARRPLNNRNEVSHRAQLKETLKEYGFAKGLQRFEIYGFRSFCVC